MCQQSPPPQSSCTRALGLFREQTIGQIFTTNPGNMLFLRAFEAAIKHYCALLTRTTGKGIFLVFVGCSLWDCLSGDAPELVSFVVFVTGMADCGIGGVMVFFGTSFTFFVHSPTGGALLIGGPLPLESGRRTPR